jgi:hypothetical protein
MMDKMFTPEMDAIAKEHFVYQYENNPVYRSFVDHVAYDVNMPFSLSRIPYLPISAFKHHAIKSGQWMEDVVYTSSGTGGSQSRHFVKDNLTYLDNCQHGFQEFYGNLEEYTFFALLPGYLEREGSSLITMMDYFIKQSENSDSGFFLKDYKALLKALLKAKEEGRKTILWGVTYALLDFATFYNLDWPELIVLETGGMKGKRKEMIKRDLHQMLQKMYRVEKIHSEYGMTELLSQAYSKGDGLFLPSKTMHVHCRSVDDPFEITPLGKTGQIHIFDQANWNTTSFIATEDLGRMVDVNTFEIIGRKDNSEQRGCNLLLEEIAV